MQRPTREKNVQSVIWKGKRLVSVYRMELLEAMKCKIEPRIVVDVQSWMPMKKDAQPLNVPRRVGEVL